MKQILAIFKKDARHLWIDILLNLGVIVGFAVTQPFQWPSHFNKNFPEATTLSGLFTFLLPLSWWLLITRVVLDESLVGDRSFWLTRPFGWQRILSAKLLFIGAFVALPLFMAKAWLLLHAGLSPFTNLPLLLLNVTTTALIIFLPLLAIATVTATLVRMFFVVLAGCLYVGFAIYINSLFPYPPSFGPDKTPWWIFPLGICVCVGVVLLQYARRKTWVTRTALILLTIAITLITSISEHTWTAHRLYQEQAPNEPPPLTVALNPDRSLLEPEPDDASNGEQDKDVKLADTDGSSETFSKSDKGSISLPLLLNSVAANHAVRIDHVSIAYKDPVSGLISTFDQGGNKIYLPGESREAISLSLGTKRFESLKDVPLVLTLDIAVTELEMTSRDSATVANSDFAVPNGGICHPSDLSASELYLEHYALQYCQFPIARLPLTLVTLHWSDQRCEQPSTSGEEGIGWIGSDGAWDWRLDFSPVQNVSIFASGGMRPSGKGRRTRFICPGSKVTFTNYRVAHRRLLHITLPPLLPRDYTKKQEGQLLQMQNLMVKSY